MSIQSGFPGRYPLQLRKTGYLLERSQPAVVRLHEIRRLGEQGFDQSLAEVVRGRSPVERRQARAVFQGIHSGPFWQMLRDRGGLSGPEAIAVASWTAQALLDTLRREQRNFSSQPTDKKKKGD
jgi:hypothetical protein